MRDVAITIANKIGAGKTVYVAGPMSGIINSNREVFARAENGLKSHGFIVLNPGRQPDGYSYALYMKLALHDILMADAIVFLPGWEFSKGASVEKLVATTMGIPTFEAQI